MSEARLRRKHQEQIAERGLCDQGQRVAPAMPACVGLATLESGDRVVRIVMNPWWSRKAYDFPSGPNGAKRIGMALHFPNASRSYDATRHCVSFWGYDSAFEIAFHLEEKALQQISRETRAD